MSQGVDAKLVHSRHPLDAYGDPIWGEVYPASYRVRAPPTEVRWRRSIHRSSGRFIGVISLSSCCISTHSADQVGWASLRSGSAAKTSV